MGYYKNLREHVRALEAAGKLVRIKKEINKDTELMPLVRWQFRGLGESQRGAFLFEKIVDIKGKRYDSPALVGSYAASREVYALGMKCRPEEISEKLSQAQLHPIDPILLSSGPVHDEVHVGKGLLDHGGLEEFPIPISTPGFDNAPYLTSACWVTKDPETGVRNVGVYRAMLKSPTRLGISILPPKDAYTHWEKCRSRGMPLQAALVLGSVPSLGFVAASKIPYGLDELSVAGGIGGEPLEMVNCRTVDLEVPAHAEIVIEGEIPTDSMEREGPFGEYTGYMGLERVTPYFNVTCITHRKNPIYHAFISQFPPSESSMLRGISSEGAYYKFLKYDYSVPVLDVAFHESSGAWQYCVIRIKKTHPSQPWKALYGAANFALQMAKIVIVVDEDIDPRDPDSVNWALSFRIQPHRDIRITHGKTRDIDPSGAPPDAPDRDYPEPWGCSSLLIDATMKWDYPPISLPEKEFMDRAKDIWEELGLPPLVPKIPWYGYSLGDWTNENEEEARLALQGEHYRTGEKLVGKRVIP